MSRKALACYAVDLFLLIVGLACAVSGFVLWGLGEGGYRGGRDTTASALGTSRDTWRILHTATGIAVVLGAIVHVILHWRWLAKMTMALLKTKAPKAPACPPEQGNPREP